MSASCWDCKDQHMHFSCPVSHLQHSNAWHEHHSKSTLKDQLGMKRVAYAHLVPSIALHPQHSNV